MALAIKVDGVSKAYKIGEFGTGSIKSDIQRWYARVRGKEDPFTVIGEQNDRTVKGKSNIVWSLKDISFEVEKGNAIGILGRNGAGKSTLLKLLSRVTSPTTGLINMKGRIASLLEVGTGFHPELTGRENIFLNGAILGMRKLEIKRKFDEIVEFSGVQRYIDTPVKRYSSGMYVRLAFAVAAHLESEILIVDEVLAVGDAEFQKKCMGKMGDVRQDEGRTILFVSHNMSAIRTLCKNSIYLNKGEIVSIGDSQDIIEEYSRTESELNTTMVWNNDEFNGDHIAKIARARVIDKNHEVIDIVQMNEKVGVEFEYRVLEPGYHPIPNIFLYNIQGEIIFVSLESSHKELHNKGTYLSTVWIPPSFLNDGRYVVGIALSTLIPEKIHFFEKDSLTFEVVEDMELRTNEYRWRIPGYVRPELQWDTQKLN